MIEVTRLDDSKIVVNVEKIQSLQATPDTIITFTTHERMMVKEPVEEVSEKILAYQRSVHRGEVCIAP
jgi:flagellar protein FlbD